MEVIKVTGSAFERGYQHGKAFTHKARNCIQYWFPKGKVDINEKDVINKLDLIEHNLLRYFPTLLDELKGVSIGAGIPFKDILLLNSAAEFGRVEEIVYCTNIVLSETPHGTLHGYNWDHNPEVGARFVVGEVATFESGLWVSRTTWSGTNWTIAGINSAGLTQGMSGVWSTNSNWDDGIPSMMLARLPLEQCANVEEAVNFLETVAPIATSFNLVFTDVLGNAAVVEKSPTGQAVRYLNGKAIFCTNMFVTEKMQGVLNTNKAELLKNALNRYKTLEQLTNESRLSWDISGLQDILRFHGDSASICMHARASDPTGLYTARSHLMIPVDRRILVTEGNPCKFPFIPLSAWLQ
jgi:isopenicillin-N N-acyltransferase-like protein